jgi:hypothetical protein
MRRFALRLAMMCLTAFAVGCAGGGSGEPEPPANPTKAPGGGGAAAAGGGAAATESPVGEAPGAPEQ